MDWKEVAAVVGKFAPLLGTLIGGPAGPIVGSMVASVLGTPSTPDAISQALATNPDAAVKLQSLESARQVRFQELAVDQARAELAAVTQAAGDVNKTMQAEAASEHWPTYGWRPAIGFAVAIDLVLCVVVVGMSYIGVMFAGIKPDVLSYLPQMVGAMAALVGVASPILGIASWFRGKMQADPAVPTVNRG